MSFIIFPDLSSAQNLNIQINSCMGYPNANTQTWMPEPYLMCEYNLETYEKISIGYGIIIKDEILNCLTPQQLQEVFVLPANINTCSQEPFTGTTTTTL